MKLSEYKGEEAIELLADILEPTVEIFADDDVRKAITNDEPKMKIISKVLKSHKKEIIQIMARMDNTPVEKYEVNVLTLPKKVLEILNDEDLNGFFKSQYQSTVENASGSATENIKETEAE